MNYYKSIIKCAIFMRLSQFDKFNFDKEFYNKIGENSFTPKYFMMEIKKEENGNYIPETSFSPINFANFFHQQELALPTQILTCTNYELSKMVSTFFLLSFGIK